MRTLTKALALGAGLTLSLSLAACGADSGSAPTESMAPSESMDSMAPSESMDSMEPMDSMSPSESMDSMEPMASTGMFEGVGGKMVTGTAELSGSKLILKDFASDEAPDLHVYLTNGSTEADVEAGMELGKVRYDQAMQEFALDEMQAGMYNTVVIHCDKAKTVYGAASLS
ncbi:DM13 domain-containing protein [Glutamicibacter sp. PS]|uniref:DM13 domain-containing protein n=1 Tax=Glutamicibacter sp. PS TaxID=3075634 RepID=UPI00284B8B69|nr:DM13 domain-containing protein [Glutamicibacter sp. PS]MDR4534528.1 DM13 domain-containing protein [Glutamicibacter sp. PS]